MKKTLFRIVAILLILVLSSSSVISTTLAKYVTHGGAFTDEARVAKWGVEILTTVESLFDNTYSSKKGEDEVITVKSDTDVVAPGTSKWIEIDTYITGQPEVAFEVSNIADIELIDWVGADGNYYCPLYFSVNGQEMNGMQFINADEFEKWIEEEVARVVAQYEPGTNLEDITKSVDDMLNLTVSWRWAFDNDEYSNDIDDTHLGNAENKAEIIFNFTQMVVQIQEFDETYSSIKTYSLKDDNKILFGSYPQTDVTADMGETLNGMVNDPSEHLEGWTSYNYIEGDMHYIDVNYDGQKYRGIYYKTARNSYQKSNYPVDPDNKYAKYWFKYEPIEWTILSQSNDEAFLLCNIALDSQPYQPEYMQDNGSDYNSSKDVPAGIYANNYAYSNIRKWLNNDFYNTAFNNLQKQIILVTNVKNDLQSTKLSGKYKCMDTQDRVFLLSYEEAILGKYRIDGDKTYAFTYAFDGQNRIRVLTDYAKSQGAYTEHVYAWWWLRSPSSNGSIRVDMIKPDGSYHYDRAHLDENTVVPALRISLSGDVKAYKVTERDSENNITKLEFGSYPQSEVKVTDDMADDEKAETTALISTLNAKAGDPTTDAGIQNWTSYGYSSGEMYYNDVTLNGKKYRGVYIAKKRTATGNLGDYDSDQEANEYYATETYWFAYEPIEWTVLENQNGKALILCDLAVDAQPFLDEKYVAGDRLHHKDDDAPENTPANNYEYSTIRKWLNETFYDTAFSGLQKHIMLITNVAGEDSIVVDINDPNTCNNLFLLSKSEAETTYGLTGDNGKKNATDYAKAQGVYVCLEDNLNTVEWFLRTSPGNKSMSYYVSETGIIEADACYKTYYGIAPAIWINL